MSFLYNSDNRYGALHYWSADYPFDGWSLSTELLVKQVHFYTKECARYHSGALFLTEESAVEAAVKYTKDREIRMAKMRAKLAKQKIRVAQLVARLEEAA